MYKPTMSVCLPTLEGSLGSIKGQPTYYGPLTAYLLLVLMSSHNTLLVDEVKDITLSNACVLQYYQPTYIQ